MASFWVDYRAHDPDAVSGELLSRIWGELDGEGRGRCEGEEPDRRDDAGTDVGHRDARWRTEERPGAARPAGRATPHLGPTEPGTPPRGVAPGLIAVGLMRPGTSHASA